ncbi:MAG TPA: hypothetical protein VFP52_04220 [Myxococcales bacterium]|nr:hypothetical protein [Myxococcales bacterium]HET9752135.1 hypothetical protein [Myxococcales bacterium]
MTSASRTARLAPFALASAAACALGLGACLLLPGPLRSAAVHGAAAASLGALVGLGALSLSAGKGINGLLAAFTVGFLCRAVLVAAGLLVSGARGNLALVYTGAFFTLYAATQLVEVLFVHRSSRPQGATP